MGFRDRFRKDESGASQSDSKVILSVSEAELAYWHTVKYANHGAAEQVVAGQAEGMPPDLQAWFVENSGKAVNPEEFGIMWYLDAEHGSAQLVSKEMLVATGMDKPENQPGTTTWAMEPAEPTDEARGRKARNMADLEQRQVATIDHLPFVEDSSEVTLRTVDEIVDRAVCLMAVSIKAEVFNDGDVVAWHPVLLEIIDYFQVEDALTPNERAFADNLEPDQQTAIQFLWRYEGLAVMLWALGFVDELAYPSGICDVPHVVNIIKDQGPEGLKANARMRSVDEILDQVDFIYRLHWAVRQAQLGQGEAVPNTESGVVMERHHALNWLLASRNEDWDTVSTST